jgi:hypothetical protein
VESLFVKIGKKDVDYSDIRRIGEKGSGPRPIIVKFVRMREKLAILAAKNELRKKEETRNIYISSELTKREAICQFHLRDHARKLKSTEPGLKFFIRSNVLHTDVNGAKEHFKSDEDGNITEVQ